MIVICGELSRPATGGISASGVAVRAAAAGATTQVVGVVPQGGAGDRRLLELAMAGVGHVAVLREPAREVEPADLDLALRYLPEARVIVCLAMPVAVVETASQHAAWSGAALVVADADGRAGAAPSGGEARVDGAIVLAAPARDPDGTFAGFVGTLAARLDAGATPADAWAGTTRDLAVDSV